MDSNIDNKIKELALDFYQGNTGTANSKYFNMLQQLEGYEPFVKNAEKVLKMQENEDWVAIGDFFNVMAEDSI